MATSKETVKTQSTPVTYKKKDGQNDVTYRVEQIMNGFLVTKDWSSKDNKGNHEYHCEKYYSKDDPFSKTIEDKFTIMENALRKNQD